jgi:hypothetical protein
VRVPVEHRPVRRRRLLRHHLHGRLGQALDPSLFGLI